MTSGESKFFELLRIALGTQEELVSTISLEEWDEIAEIAAKQCVMGLLYSAIELLPKGQRPPNNILLAIHERVEEIEERNRYMNKLTYAASKRFEVDGFPNCVLKGQGIATLYPNPLRRESGDIDIWVKGERKEIVEYVQKIGNGEKPNYHHIGFSLKDGTPVEAHFTPSLSFNPIINLRLQRWFKEQQDSQLNTYMDLVGTPKTIPVPTLEFNAVFILHHLFKHLAYEGIVLRQIIDYFYVLCNINNQSKEPHYSEEMKLRIHNRIAEFNMKKFSEAISWIILKYLNIQPSYLITDTNEKEGEFLINQIFNAKPIIAKDEIKEENRFIKRYHNARPYFSHYFTEAIFYPLQSVFSLIRKFIKLDI